MQKLNAVDAIGPAWAHTRHYLVAPRSWRLLLKVGVVAAFAGMAGTGSGGGGNMHMPGGNAGREHFPQHLPLHSLASLASLVPLLIAGAVVLVVLALLLFYVSSRLQLVFFEMVLRQDSAVGPIWARYGELTWRWIGLRLLFGVLTLVCLLPILIPLVYTIVDVVKRGDANLGLGLGMAFGLGGLMLIVVLLISAVYRVVADFGVPIMALDRTTVSGTLRQVWGMVQVEPGQMALYVVVRVVLSIAVGIASLIVSVLCAVAAGIPLGALALLVWLMLGHATGFGHVAMIGGYVLLGSVMVLLLVVLGLMLAGLVGTFYEAYALYFLGGRYPRVAAYLEPLMPPPPPVWQPIGTPAFGTPQG